ncbi:Txe/YoeB family addiction module toxin [uncultured Algibacter sp.]|uniref:Txe/YoeB family addiction module toxin n=1 Tax=uncultured Algibacter sp. TaxID=298659 RepID=UPI0026393B21|nr:Txe/YoeB family addiction module toxin [uncultured Algibacter sp.]
MIVAFTSIALEQYQYWGENDKKIFKKINTLITNTKRTHFVGLGNPEPLKGILKGYWSRRITQEHRLVYKISGTDKEQVLTIVQCRYHY